MIAESFPVRFSGVHEGQGIGQRVLIGLTRLFRVCANPSGRVLTGVRFASVLRTAFGALLPPFAYALRLLIKARLRPVSGKQACLCGLRKPIRLCAFIGRDPS